MQWVFDKGVIVGQRADAPVAGVERGVADCGRGPTMSSSIWRTRSSSTRYPTRDPRTLLKATVVREPRATFSLAPGQPARPSTDTPVPGLYLAGDWIDTGLPATIESAVRSGHLRPLGRTCSMNSIVVHYKELALKGRNRPWFIQMLVRNLTMALADLDGDRRFVPSWAASKSSSAPSRHGPTRPSVSRRSSASRIFHSRGRAPLDFDALAAAILDDLGDRQPESFRVSVRRADKRFPLTSPQIEREVGGRIKEAKGWRVDLENPALNIHIEMLPDHAFYFFGKEPGAGGLPTGTGGRVACLLSGGIDSPVAAYRMMRRGCTVLLVHFHSYPILSRASQEKTREIATLLDASSTADAARARRLRRAPAAGVAGRAGRASRGRVPAPDVPDRRADCATLARASARHRRGRRSGGVADARKHDDHRRCRQRWKSCDRWWAWTKMR